MNFHVVREVSEANGDNKYKRIDFPITYRYTAILISERKGKQEGIIST